MRIVFKPLTAALLAIGFASGAAHGQSMPDIKLSGFGTVAGTYTSEEHADFITSRIQPNGAGMTRNFSTSPDSKLGVQADVKFTDSLSGVLQLVSQHQYDNSFKPQLEWANVKYQATPDLAVRVGRIALPYFLYSDSRLVNYAQPWLRLPTEAYMVNPNTSNDGIDVMYRVRTGSVTHGLQAFYGKSELKAPGGSKAEGAPNWGFNDVATFGDWTLRAGYTYAMMDIPGLNFVSQAYNAFTAIPGPTGAEAARLASTYSTYDMKFHTLVLGGIYDPGNWFVTGEYIKMKGASVAPGTKAWYLSGGYRFGSVTPYVTYATTRNDTKTESGPGAPFLYNIANAFIGNPNKQSTTSLGARWDFMRNTALKAQYDRIQLGPNSTGRLLVPVGASTKPDRNVDLFSLSVDFVF